MFKKAKRLTREFAGKFLPFFYRPSRYAGTFLDNGPLPPKNKDINKDDFDPIPHVIWVFWTGDNEITPNRERCLKVLTESAGVEVKLITPDTLSQYIKDEDPLPECFYSLSCNHRSDFLRTYFMYHYGGGYTDIKENHHSWVAAFDKLEGSKAYGIGYPELRDFVARPSHPETLYNDLYFRYRELIGNGAFIFRPHTEFSKQWYSECRKRLDEYSEKVMMNPATDPFGSNKNYPIPWAYLQGLIFHPLCLKFTGHLLKDKSILPNLSDYR